MAMTVRFQAKLDLDLEAVAAAQGLSKQQALVAAVEAYVERNKQQGIVQEAFDLVLERDAELLARLADA